MDLNVIALTGRLGRDPEIRYTPNGKAVADIALAVQTGFGDNESTAWVELTLWDKQAESAGKYLSKGSKIAVSGRLEQDAWEDKNGGGKRSKLKVIVQNWTFASAKTEGVTRPATREEVMPDSSMEDSDIPF